MKAANYTQYVGKLVKNNEINKLFTSHEIAENLASFYNIPLEHAKPTTNTLLKRLYDKGTISRHQKGIYYRAEDGVFGKSKPKPTEIIFEEYIQKDNTIFGYETGASFLNSIGLTTQVPKKTVVATNAYSPNRATFDKKINVVTKKPVLKVDVKNYLYLQFLDLMTSWQTSPIDNPNWRNVLKSHISENELRPEQLLVFAKKHYPNKTLMNLVDFFVEVNDDIA